MRELRNISAGYETGFVLRNINLTVPKAFVVALLGANGAGKTTQLRTASGQLSPVTGAVTLDGMDMTGKRSEKLQRACAKSPKAAASSRRCRLRRTSAWGLPPV